MKYFIVESRTIKELIKIVNVRISEGCIALGSPTVIPNQSIIQAMLRRE